MKKVAKTQVSVNNKKIELDNKENLTLLDALIEAGYSRDVIMPSEQKGIEIQFNGEPTKVCFGIESATKVFLNEERAGLLSLIKSGDKIRLEELEVNDNTTIKLSALDEYNEHIVFDIDGNMVPLLRLVEVNGRLNFGDVEVKNGDIVKSYDFYTAAQLRESLGLEDDIVIMSEEKELTGDDPVFEKTIIDTYVRYNENQVNDKKEGPSFKLIIGDDYTFNMDETEEMETTVVDEVEEINVILNGETVHLNNKKRYAVIDALDGAGIDAMQAAGKNIVIKVNSNKASFSTNIANEDVVEFSFN